MAVEAPTEIPSSDTKEVSQWQDLGHAQTLQSVTQNQHLIPDGHLEKSLKRDGLLQKLAVSGR